jgi:hypothetical protein
MYVFTGGESFGRGLDEVNIIILGKSGQSHLAKTSTVETKKVGRRSHSFLDCDKRCQVEKESCGL